MKKGRICFKCHKEIKLNEHHFEFIEIKNEDWVKTDYAHKVCWDIVKNDLALQYKAKGMLDGLSKKMREQGLLPEEEVIIG